jgi:hypothetical protein
MQKKSYILPMIIIVVVLVGGLFFLFKTPATPTATQQVQGITVAASHPTSSSVIEESGEMPFQPQPPVFTPSTQTQSEDIFSNLSQADQSNAQGDIQQDQQNPVITPDNTEPADANGQEPAGATAECTDGTYSLSQDTTVACTGHSGVQQWLQD